MSTKTRRLSRAAAVVLAFAALFAFNSATPAHAIARGNCNNNNYTAIWSDATTCWGGAGGIAVSLLNTVGVHAGNNTGYLDFHTQPSKNFNAWTDQTWSSRRVVYISIF